MILDLLIWSCVLGRLSINYLILLPYAKLSMVELNEAIFIARLPNDTSIRCERNEV